MADSFLRQDTDVLLLLDDNPRWLWPDQPPPVRAIDCGDFARRCGVGANGSLLLLLDRNLRIVFQAQPADTAELPLVCLAHLEALPREAPRAILQPAPAIVLPNLLSHDICRTLIGRFESSEAIDGEVARIDPDGAVRSVVDHSKKRRLDMPIGPADPLHAALRTVLLRRCAPEIAKAFQATVTHTDRILLSRYDADAGWFRRHRDNAAPNVAFRQFALSVNLNTGDYEGGHLLFPEYNDHQYAPPVGGGLIFSTGLLHEAAPVTSGSRYVLLTFFHGDAAEDLRLGYLSRSDARLPSA